MEDVNPDRLICQSTKVLGNGRIQDLRDLVVVDLHRFERAHSQEVAEGVAHFNAKLEREWDAVSADWSGTLGIE